MIAKKSLDNYLRTQFFFFLCVCVCPHKYYWTSFLVFVLIVCCRYADFLSRLNDDRNIRALFERALNSLPPEESVEVKVHSPKSVTWFYF